MSLQTLAFTAGETKQFREVGSFFRILSTTGGIVDVMFYRAGACIAEAVGVQPGFSEKFDEPFTAVTIKSAAVQTIQFVIREGSEVTYDVPPGGTLIFPASSGAYAQTAPALSGTASNALAANAARRMLAIQNNDAAQTIWINCGGTATLAAPSIKLGPGGYWEAPSGFVPTGAISVIATGATSAVSFIQG